MILMNKLKAILIIMLLISPLGFIDKPNNHEIQSTDKSLKGDYSNKTIELIRHPLEVKKLDDYIFSLKIPVDLRGYKRFTDNDLMIPFYEGGDLEIVPGRPIVPVFLFVRKVPTDSKIISVKLENFSYMSERIDKRLAISPNPLAIGYNISYFTPISPYNYPPQWIKYEVKYGCLLYTSPSPRDRG